jgi:diacylglycerol kinase
MIVVVSISAVWTAEALNTAIECLADAVAPHRHPLVGAAKDVAACAVLLAATGAVVVGAIILGPQVVALLHPSGN